MTPRLVRRRYSKGLVLLAVWRNGYRNRGMWAARNAELKVSKTLTCTPHVCITDLTDCLIHANHHHYSRLCNIDITDFVKYAFRSMFWQISCSRCACRLPSLHMWGHTLQQRQGITHSVRLMSRQRGRVYRGIDVHDFLLGNKTCQIKEALLNIFECLRSNSLLPRSRMNRLAPKYIPITQITHYLGSECVLGCPLQYTLNSMWKICFQVVHRCPGKRQSTISKWTK